MTPITPIVPGLDLPVTLLAKDQPQYSTLPVFIDQNGAMVSRWKFTLRERLTLLFTGNLWMIVLTFGQPFQPVKLTVESPIEP